MGSILRPKIIRPGLIEKHGKGNAEFLDQFDEVAQLWIEHCEKLSQSPEGGG